MESLPVHYAGFWRRFLAHILDSMIIGAASLVLVVPFLLIVGVGTFSLHDIDTSYDSESTLALIFALIAGYLFLILLIVIASWLYYALMESSAKQGTLGKMAIGIKVTDLAGNRITFGRATGRYFGKIISALTLNIGYLMAGFTQQKQSLHDMIAGCLVVLK
jgi:uncharacterized RDD family membrane protein YckC